MSTHAIPTPARSIIGALCHRYLRPPVDTLEDGSLVFEPDLTPEEVTTLAMLVSIADVPLSLTPEEWAGLQTEIDGLRTYHGLATPTNAQTVLAVKAIIRVLRAILRD